MFDIINGVKIRITRNINEFRANMGILNYYCNKGSHEHIGLIPEEDYCQIITIAFNNSTLINFQIHALSKFFEYPFSYTVYDNSSDISEANKIEDICIDAKVGYVRLPQQKYIKNDMASYSHGIALNWVWNNYIKRSQAKYFAILDHDIFPIESFNLEKYLINWPVYGLFRNNDLSMSVRKEIHYLWPGFSFFLLDYLRGKKIDFRPDFNHNADTGAKNYYSLYKNIDKEIIDQVKVKRIVFDSKGNCFENGYEYFECGWIHMWNGSNYKNSQLWENKMSSFIKVLQEKIEEKNDYAQS